MATSVTGRLHAASDELLTIRAADGDVAAFEVLVRRHLPTMRAYAWRLTSSDADADDAIQNALVLAWQRIGTVRDPAAARSWLMRVVGRCAVDLVRRRHPTDDIEAVPEPHSSLGRPDQAAELDGALAALATALDALPVLPRLCWVMREIGGESYGEIADQLGTSTATVRGALARARRSLTDAMEEWR